jgi:tetratricopeptide (TPR) repeat protein
VVRLNADLTETERAAAEAAYPEETFEVGIGEQLVAADKLADRYDNAGHGGEPHGWAVVQAAIDWVRMDIGRPIRRSELHCLYPIYLRMVRPTDETLSDLDKPLAWARMPVGSRIALLQPVIDSSGEAAYQPLDYLVALADGQHGRDAQPLPEDTWSQAAHLVTATERYRASVSAFYRGLPHVCRTLLISVMESGDSDLAAWATANLGVLLQWQGDFRGANAAFRQAIASGHPEMTSWVVKPLVMHRREGDFAEANAAFRQVIASGHPEATSWGLTGLGWLLADERDFEGANAAFRQAIDSGHPEAAQSATEGLMLLLARQGDFEGAKAVGQHLKAAREEVSGED